MNLDIVIKRLSQNTSRTVLHLAKSQLSSSGPGQVRVRKGKVNPRSFELDINASQACSKLHPTNQ